MKTTAVLLMALCVAAHAQTADTFTDTRDGKTYRTVKIGEQVWMAENLNYHTDRSWCYRNDTSHCAIYGRVYVWEAAMMACPAGWHLPTRGEWSDLVTFVGNLKTAGAKLKSKWYGGTDDYGFSANPGGGLRYPDFYPDTGYFRDLGSRSGWWTATERGASSAYFRLMDKSGAYIYEGHIGKKIGYSVRCLRD
jgi:uncharacterized protein (TIGR02145 family)